MEAQGSSDGKVEALHHASHRDGDQAVRQRTGKTGQTAILVAEYEGQPWLQHVRGRQAPAFVTDMRGQNPIVFFLQSGIAFLDGLMEGVVQPLMCAGAGAPAEDPRVEALFAREYQTDTLDPKGITAAQHSLGVVLVVDVFQHYSALLAAGHHLIDPAESAGIMHASILTEGGHTCYAGIVRILVTGFEPFGNLVANPSARLLELLNAAQITGCSELITELLPTAYAKSAAGIRGLLDRHRPDLCICLGVAQNRRHVSLERIAMNLDDCSLADNDGELAAGREIVPGEALALKTGIPLEELQVSLADSCRDAAPDLDIAISNHAGNFVCNHIYYNALQHVKCRQLATQCLFVHVPMTRESRGPQEEYAWELPGEDQLLGLISTLIAGIVAGENQARDGYGPD